MSIESKEEFIIRLENLDKETLYFLSKYAEERRRTSNLVGTITAVIGSIAGAVLLLNYALPHLNDEILVAAAGIAGSLVAVAAVMTRKREDDKVIRKILLRAEVANKINGDNGKRELIERFLKAEGL
ncbi:hypothetical protein J7373_09365 [Xanthomonas sp. A2111]|uniref:Uncharacterized protein n=1 Tax=Xanthomonas hawaiiensis TaxID=3003247 RepID=A0ABU2I5R7_9XANT|nr:hypothetical protein [Xanthomonas sp. A2111]MBO9828453.1 hypothetical protein [Xanthomonas sp. A2111]MDS9993200.1 hypothetical protein [Xanthomonas sp. A2111]